MSEREFVIEFWRSVVRGSRAHAHARARAPDQLSRSAIMQEFCSRLSGSTILVVRERNSGLYGYMYDIYIYINKIYTYIFFFGRGLFFLEDLS